MTHIESEIKTVHKPAAQIFGFLEDFNNWEQLMPDRVEKWSSTIDTCSFTIKGTGSLGMKIKERIPSGVIKIANDDSAPFKFDLLVSLTAVSAAETRVQFSFDAELNLFLELLVKPPLTNFLNMLVDKLETVG
jgi:hypothetical protein